MKLSYNGKILINTYSPSERLRDIIHTFYTFTDSKPTHPFLFWVDTKAGMRLLFTNIGHFSTLSVTPISINSYPYSWMIDGDSILLERRGLRVRIETYPFSSNISQSKIKNIDTCN